MKNYLLLEDGTIFYGEINGDARNYLGNLTLTEDGIKVHCNLTKCFGFVNSSSNESSNLLITNKDFLVIKDKLDKNKIIQGKIVTDSLPVEYHLFDIKTYIPVY